MKLKTLALTLFCVVYGLACDKKMDQPSRPKTPIKAMIMFKSSIERTNVMKMDKPKYDLSQMQILGEKLASIELPPEVEYLSFKKWMESQNGVILVEKDSNVHMMKSPRGDEPLLPRSQ